MRKHFLILTLFFFGCTTATLSNGKSIATFKGAKVFSPTVFSLREGNCAVPTVDAAGVMQEPQIAPLVASANSCTTTVMTTNGVDVKGLVNVIMSAMMSALAAVATGS